MVQIFSNITQIITMSRSIFANIKCRKIQNSTDSYMIGDGDSE